MVIKRYLERKLAEHLSKYRQMAFLSGPRQVGKTTLSQSIIKKFPRSIYLSWENVAHRTTSLQDVESFALTLSLQDLQSAKTLCAINELHKKTDWRDFLKSIYDTYPELTLLVTGSAMLSFLGRGGDSLRGRYFRYTLHPFSAAELVRGQPATDGLIHNEPKELPEEQWLVLLNYGGYPDPFIQANTEFHNRWLLVHHDQVIREDIRDLTRIQDLSQIESLAIQLRYRVGNLTNFESLARQLRCSNDSVRRWVATLKSLYFCFTVAPWYANVPRSLRKEPKIYLWDWSQIKDHGSRLENMVACALLKAVDYWTETGQGVFALHYLRDKQKREVDFVVVRDEKPWLLVDVKASRESPLNPGLTYFKEKLNAPYAVQVAFDSPFISKDSVRTDRPYIVPAKSFLSQLV